MEVGDPGPGQARVRHTYIAVNFIDIYFRTGHYPLELPNGLGSDELSHDLRADFERNAGIVKTFHIQPE